MNDHERAAIALGVLALAAAGLLVALGGDDEPRVSEEPEAAQPPEVAVLRPTDPGLVVTAHDSAEFTVRADANSSSVDRVVWRQGNLTLLTDPCSTNCSSFESRLIRTFETPGTHEIVVRAVDQQGRGAEATIPVEVGSPPPGACTQDLPCQWLVSPPPEANGTDDEVRLEAQENEMFELKTTVGPAESGNLSLDAVRWVQESGKVLRNTSCDSRCQESDQYRLLWSFDDPGTYRIEAQAIAEDRIQDTLTWNITVQDSQT